jgi:short subunit dehydrogenase-like uncharacterized protein
VVLNTVGPFAQYGEPVVSACVQAGTDYVDITGEPAFVDAMIARYDAPARERGVRIVHCCGFDSIPHDLGVLFTVRQLPRELPMRVDGVVRAHGGLSGGTWQSAVEALSHLRQQGRSMRRASSGSEGGRKVRGMRPRVHRDRELDCWLCPLPTIDPQIVLRSARALDEYGPDFRYGHWLEVKSTASLVGGLLGVGAVVALAQLGPTRALLRRVRKSGQGPNEAQRARGWFEVTFRATADSHRVVTRVSGGDPGYGETAKMVAESALCLAFDRDTLPARAGVLTPAVAMGDVLIERLRRAGIRIEVLEHAGG